MGVRLGYASINLSLQQEKGGPRYRGLTAKRLGPMQFRERRAHLYQVGKNNLQTLAAILRWNEQHAVRLHRITSDLIPLATHPVAAGWDWAEDLAAEFAACAALARKTGARLSMHPGQYTVLNAPDPEVVERAVADLRYHARVLDLLELGPEAGMVLHIGGAYGDREAALRRFIANFAALPPEVAGRLWVENDDRVFDTEEALEVAAAIGRPMVLDIHHHRVLREDDWLPWLERALSTWGAVRPKVHFSTPRDGLRSRSHADGIDAADFADFLGRTEGMALDVMLECKAKDLALLALRRDLAARGIDAEGVGFSGG